MASKKAKDSITDLGNGYRVIKRQLGKGKFGIVYNGYDPWENMLAAKQIEVRENVETIQNKLAQALGNLKEHRNILKILELIIKNNSIWLMSEVCDEGNLVHYLKKYYSRSRIGLESSLQLMNGCLQALEFLHSSEPPLIHQMIQPYNILIKNERNLFRVKLAECAMADTFDKEHVKTYSTLPHSGKTYKDCYKAPEYFEAADIRTKAYDVFCLGTVFHAVCTYKLRTTRNANINDVQIYPVLTEEYDGERIGKYVSDCHTKGRQPMLFTDSEESDMFDLQNLVEKMLLYEADQRKPTIELCSAIHQIGSKELPTSDGIFKFDIANCLGSGDFGTTYHGYSMDNPSNKVAIKRLHVSLKMEAMPLLENARHDNINKITHIYHDEITHVHWLIMEYCKYDLEQYFESSSTDKSLSSKLKIIKQCVAGLDFLHSLDHKISHGSIKPSNILLKKSGEQYQVQLADAVLSTAFADIWQKTGKSFSNRDFQTIYFAAPECLNDYGFLDMGSEPGHSNRKRSMSAVLSEATSKKIKSDLQQEDLQGKMEQAKDIFSLGLIFYLMLQHKETMSSFSITGFQKDDAIATQVLNRENKEDRAILDEATITLDNNGIVEYLIPIVQQMLAFDVKARPGITDISASLKKLFSCYSDHKLLSGDDEEFLELEKLVEEFSVLMDSDAPEYIQHCNASIKYFRININIDHGKLHEANEMMKNRCPEHILPYLHLVEQQERPHLLASEDRAGVRDQVKPGSVLTFKSQNEIQQIVNVANQFQTFESAIKSIQNGTLRFGTIGGFVSGSNGSHYGVTSKHTISDTVGYSVPGNLEALSAFKNGANSTFVPVQLTTNATNVGIYDGFDVNGVRKLVDIALIQLSQHVIVDPNVRFAITPAPWQNQNANLQPNIIQDITDPQLRTLYVRKLGAETDHTTGQIMSTNHRVWVGGRYLGGGVFIVQSTEEQPHMFANNGDSGAFVLKRDDDGGNWCLGIIRENQPQFVNPDGLPASPAANMTLCSRIDHSFDCISHVLPGVELKLV